MSFTTWHASTSSPRPLKLPPSPSAGGGREAVGGGGGGWINKFRVNWGRVNGGRASKRLGGSKLVGVVNWGLNWGGGAVSGKLGGGYGDSNLGGGDWGVKKTGLKKLIIIIHGTPAGEALKI